MGLIKCPNCGELIDDGAYVCPKCWHIFNDGSQDQHEEWAIKMKKKDKFHKRLALAFLLSFMVLSIVFFTLLMWSGSSVIHDNGTRTYDYSTAYTVLSIVFISMFIYTLIICGVMHYRNVLVQTFDGYSVVVKHTFMFVKIYVENKEVLKKPKNYHHDTYKVSLPNSKFVNILLTAEVCTFELSNE